MWFWKFRFVLGELEEYMGGGGECYDILLEFFR